LKAGLFSEIFIVCVMGEEECSTGALFIVEKMVDVKRHSAGV
jgi:hypothetical protein